MSTNRQNETKNPPESGTLSHAVGADHVGRWRSKRRASGFSAILGCIMVFAVATALMLPAMSMTHESASLPAAETAQNDSGDAAENEPVPDENAYIYLGS